MGLFIKKEGKEYETCEPGSYLAKCVRVIDLGTQESNYQGKIKHSKKILISWALDEKDSEGNNFIVSNRYTVSLSTQAILYKDLCSWRGRDFTEEELGGFNLVGIAGKYCIISMTIDNKDGKKYTNVQSIMPLMKGQKAQGIDVPEVIFDLDEYDADVFAEFSDGLKEIIAKSPEFVQLKLAEKVEVMSGKQVLEESEDLPF